MGQELYMKKNMSKHVAWLEDMNKYLLVGEIGHCCSARMR